MHTGNLQYFPDLWKSCFIYGFLFVSRWFLKWALTAREADMLLWTTFPFLQSFATKTQVSCELLSSSWIPTSQQNTWRNHFSQSANMLIPGITSTEPTFDPSVANCDFESGLCLYTQDRSAASSWRRVSVKPNIFRNGDHTTGAGERKLQIRLDDILHHTFQI